MSCCDGTDIILSVKNVSKVFPGVKALDNVSIQVKRGTVHGIVGENGAGKSTLMKILSGVYKKDSGTIIFDGKPMECTEPVQSLHMGLSIIYQEFNLISTMSVGENIFMGRFREIGGMANTHAEARKLLDSIGCPIDTYTSVSKLSVSEKQMVEIAKALSYNAKLIIMDEPSATLTDKEMARLEKIIKSLRTDGVSIIYISHKLDEIFDFCDSVTVMRDGWAIDTKPVTEFTRASLIEAMVGRSMEREYPERPRTTGGVLLEVRGLRTKKLHDISFELRRGEILGLVGLVGSGRTEIIRAIFGADRIKDGKVFLDGKDIHVRSPIDAKRLGMGLVPEDRKEQGLVLQYSVMENITMAITREISKMGFIDRAREKDIATKQVDNLKIKTPSIQTKVMNLSGGNQQKCIVGRWLERNPAVLILDEPTRGIDVGAKYEIYLLMRQIAENGGAIILISSELPEVLNMSNRVLTVCDGRITGEFDPERASVKSITEKIFG